MRPLTQGFDKRFRSSGQSSARRPKAWGAELVSMVSNWHPVILETRNFTWPDEAACAAWAQALAARPAIRNASIELIGPLGAGKTTFVRHLLQALGARGRIKSPSYAIVEPYDLAGLKVWHFDYYRFGDPREWEDAGFRELYAEPGLKLSEWPQKVGALMPTPDLRLDIEPDAQDAHLRHVRTTAMTTTGRELMP